MSNVLPILPTDLSVAQEIWLTDSRNNFALDSKFKEGAQSLCNNRIIKIKEQTNIGLWYHVPDVESITHLPPKGSLTGKLLSRAKLRIDWLGY